MDIISRESLLPFSKIELVRAEQVIEKYGGKRCSADDYYMNTVIGCSYSESDNSVTYRKLKHLECSFKNIVFDGTDGASSIMIDCCLIGCKFNNAGFNTSDFTQTEFSQNTTVINSGFDNSNFSASIFKETEFEGCSFCNSTFNGSQINSCKFHCCDFEACVFEDSHIKNVDFTTTGINYAEFNNVRLENVIFSCWSILRCFGGLQTIEKFKDKISLRLPGNKTIVPASEFLDDLDALQAHFYYKKDYFSLANINIYLGNQKQAFLYLKEGLAYNLCIKNFKIVKYLCKLASRNYFFSKKQLSQLYYAIQSNEYLKKMTTYEYRIYLYEINEIKKLLIDNPFRLPQINIKIYTNIDHRTENELLKTFLTILDKVIDINAPTSIYSVAIRHNSPVFLELIDCDNLENLYQIVLYLITALWGAIPQINAFLESLTFVKQLHSPDFKMELKEQELKIKKEELRRQQLDNELLLLEKEKKVAEIINQNLNNELLELEIERKKQELEFFNKKYIDKVQNNIEENIDVPINLCNKISKISFTISTNEILPSKLREFSIQKP